ncbi:MAG TPA: DUF72 domain-containing protein [Burkholderiaceae bacterium]|jgi:uncharacterized protein YecE (DUF72 family)
MSIRIGTASWADKGLIDTGRFYPPHATTPAARLRYYATQFPLVEIDTSFYSIPSPQAARQWAGRTPDAFVMNMKAFRLFTGHQTSPAVLPAEVREALPQVLRLKSMLYFHEMPPELLDELWAHFTHALEPLQQAGKLGLVHFQFPPWLLRNRAGHAHVAHCVERMANFKLSVEFRNISWLEAEHARETMNFQRELGVVHTIVDEPQGFTNSVPAVWETSVDDHALIRMHGRNAMSWNDKSNASSGRFNYDYDEAELEGLARQLQRLDERGLKIDVVMNNNAEDQAQRNGRTLMSLMREIGADVRMPSPPPASDQDDWIAAAEA